MLGKHTPGPLTVKVSEKWPFDIVTTDASGYVKFVTRMPCHSSEDRNAKDAIACKHFKHSEREEYSAFNRRAIADEVLRAAAPELLDALTALIPMFAEWHEEFPEHIGDKEYPALQKARAAISKAEGAQQ